MKNSGLWQEGKPKKKLTSVQRITIGLLALLFIWFEFIALVTFGSQLNTYLRLAIFVPIGVVSVLAVVRFARMWKLK